MTKPILCAGRLYCDLVFTGAPRLPSMGTEVFADGLSLHAGGGAFITAATFSALGLPVAQFSVLPAAPFDQIVKDDMTTQGVSCNACRAAAPGTDAQITVAMTGPQDRAFLTRADGAALPPLGSIDLSAYRHLHIGELRTLQDQPDLLDMARAAGLTVSLDCGWQDDFGPDPSQLIAGVDVFMPSECEAAALGDVATAAPCVVIKCGAKGAKARNHEHTEWITAPAQSANVRDTTGAGDTFNGGFIAAWLDGAALEDALEQGNRCGAVAVQALGGTAGLTALRDGAAPS